KTDPAVAKFALFELGQLYLTPPLRNGSIALKYHTQAAQLGTAWSWYAIARMYAEGAGVKRSAEKANRYYLLGLKAGERELARASAFALGELHLKKPFQDPGSPRNTSWMVRGLAMIGRSSSSLTCMPREKGYPRAHRKQKACFLSYGRAKIAPL